MASGAGVAGAGVADQEHVFLLIDVLPPDQLLHPCLVQGRLCGELERVQGFEHGEAGPLQGIGNPQAESGPITRGLPGLFRRKASHRSVSLCFA